MTTVEFDFECCGDKVVYPTAIPEGGSMFRHYAAIDTLSMLAEAEHRLKHPECEDSEYE